MRLIPGVGEDPWKEMITPQVFLPGKFLGRTQWECIRSHTLLSYWALKECDEHSSLINGLFMPIKLFAIPNDIGISLTLCSSTHSSGKHFASSCVISMFRLSWYLLVIMFRPYILITNLHFVILLLHHFPYCPQHLDFRTGLEIRVPRNVNIFLISKWVL